MSFILSVVQQLIIPEELSDPSGLGKAIDIHCRLQRYLWIDIAIPMMISNNGIDDSKLIVQRMVLDG